MKISNHKNVGRVWLIGFYIALMVSISVAQNGQVIFQALQDEMQRSLTDLKIEDLASPYFIGYTVDDFQELQIKGSLGSLTQSDLTRSRYLTVEVRVGDYDLDNSNFVSGFFQEGPNYSGISLEDNYDAIRNQVYLATDKAYKSGLKDLSKKTAYLQTRVLKNRPADFLKLPVYEYLDKPEAFDLNQAYLENLVEGASRVLRAYPMIVASEVSLTAAVGNQYLLNSNDSKSLRGDRVYTLEISLHGKNSEGEDIEDSDMIIVNNRADLPSGNEITNWAKGAADRMKALVSAETIEEYAGPVIFADDAAGELFRQLFARNISNVPAPLFDNDQMAERFPAPEFANRLKRRVLPEFFDVYDDPTINHLNGLKLVGHFKVDDAGAKSQRVQLVDDGKLVGLLIGASPTKKVQVSNGHARGAVSKEVTARPGNLIFESSDKVSFARLKQTMLEMCRDYDLEYGLVIKKLKSQGMITASHGYWSMTGQASELTAPLEVYKVYADGREEPVRNLEFSNVTSRTLRDIIQTGDQEHVYNYLIGDDYEMPVSIVCPAVLVEEMELKKSEEKAEKPAILPSPLSGE